MRRSLVVAVAVIVLRCAAPALAGIADSPLPVLATADSTSDATDLVQQARRENQALRAKDAAVSASDVGDADSFRRKVHFLGLAQSPVSYVSTDCTQYSPLPPGDTCTTVTAIDQNTTVTANDVAQIKLPARASHSLLCDSITSLPFWTYNNSTASPGQGRFTYGVGFVIDNPLLNDPSLIDPNTGLPFNGSLNVGVDALTAQSRLLQPGEFGFERHVDTRACIRGIISKASLIANYGLTSAQADQFFANPMTVHVNLQVSTRFVSDAAGLSGLRLFGD